MKTKPVRKPAIRPEVVTRPGARVEDSVSLAGHPRDELFDDVADQFEKLEQPLSLQWMQDRGVSLDELQALSQKIALVLRGYRALPPRDRIAFVSQGLFTARPLISTPAETILGARHSDAAAQPNAEP